MSVVPSSAADIVVAHGREGYSLSPLLADDAHLSRLAEMALRRAGLSKAEVARRLGCTQRAVYQYFGSTRNRRRWTIRAFLRVVQMAGGRIVLELPGDRA